MAGSGLKAEIPIDVGVHDAASTGAGVEKLPKIACDVPVRCVQRVRDARRC